MFELAPMTPADIPEAVAVWAQMPGICLRDADRPEALKKYLHRNPGCSFVARVEGKLVGAALAGHDGRRGYLHHVAVLPPFRRRGIARAIVEHCLTALREQGILKCHLFVEATNVEGKEFWNHIGWRERRDLLLMSVTPADTSNA